MAGHGFAIPCSFSLVDVWIVLWMKGWIIYESVFYIVLSNAVEIIYIVGLCL